MTAQVTTEDFYNLIQRSAWRNSLINRFGALGRPRVRCCEVCPNGASGIVLGSPEGLTGSLFST